MKTRVTIFSIVFATAMCFGTLAKAQYSDYKFSAGFDVGGSLISLLFRSISYADDPSWKASQTPTFQLNGDYRFNERFSLGAAASFSHLSVNYENQDLLPVVDDELSDFNMKLNRMNIGVRGLFYYTSSDVFEAYSGLRAGLNIWSIKMSSDDPDYDLGVDPFDSYAKAASPGLQFILVGGNIYPIENFGINFELCLGQPYFAAVGLRYRM